MIVLFDCAHMTHSFRHLRRVFYKLGSVDYPNRLHPLMTPYTRRGYFNTFVDAELKLV